MRSLCCGQRDPHRFKGVGQWLPAAGREPNQGLRGSEVGSRDGLMQNAVIMKKIKFVSKFKQNYRENVITGSVYINFKHTGAITF
jgi:hypothetical protein